MSNLAQLLQQQLSTFETPKPLKLMAFSNLPGLTYSKNPSVAPVGSKVEAPKQRTASEVSKMASSTVTNNTVPTTKAPTKLGKAYGKSLSLANTAGGQAATMGLGLVNSALENKNMEYTGNAAETINAVSGAAEKLSSKINPLGSGIVSLGKSLGQKIGGQNAAGAGTAVVNTVSQGLGYLGPIGWAAGAVLNLVNGIGGKRVKDFNDLSGQFSSDFTGSQSFVSSTHDKYAGKKFGLFDIGEAKKGNRAVDKALNAQDRILNAQEYNNKRINNGIGDAYFSMNQSKYYPGNQQIMLSKKGSKFHELEAMRSILESSKVKSFKSGGKIEKENIIPTGALHKNLHHIEEANPELEGKITKKGIPVGTYEDGGEFSQNAEIESGEIIYSLDVTKQIEEYWQNYKESGDDNIAIECGKYLVDQIFNNTRDDDKVIKKTE